jgi:hypothetical protein
MPGKLKKIITLAVSLAFAGAASAAGIGGGQPRDPACDQRVDAACATNWQTLGYPNRQTCEWGQPCVECPPNYGYLCGGAGIYHATEPKAVRPW